VLSRGWASRRNRKKGEKESIVVDGAVKLGVALQKYVSVLLTWHAKHKEDHGDHQVITDHTVSHGSHRTSPRASVKSRVKVRNIGRMGREMDVGTSGTSSLDGTATLKSVVAVHKSILG
jgi:hypothetical protein